MIPGMNARKAAQMMKKMGIQQVEVPATRVIIEGPQKTLVIENPSVSKVNMMGQTTYQVVGEEKEEAADSTPEVGDDDVDTVVEQTGCSSEEAKQKIIEKNGDLAAAIMDLKED